MTKVDEIIQDHRRKSVWSQALNNNQNDTFNQFPLPIDMQFNEGHRLSIWVYRYKIKTNTYK